MIKISWNDRKYVCLTNLIRSSRNFDIKIKETYSAAVDIIGPSIGPGTWLACEIHCCGKSQRAGVARDCEQKEVWDTPRALSECAFPFLFWPNLYHNRILYFTSAWARNRRKLFKLISSLYNFNVRLTFLWKSSKLEEVAEPCGRSNRKTPATNKI